MKIGAQLYSLRDYCKTLDDFKETLKNRRWMCGFPDCFTVMESDGYVITAFGAREQVEMFKKSAEKALGNVRVIITEDIA